MTVASVSLLNPVENQLAWDEEEVVRLSSMAAGHFSHMMTTRALTDNGCPTGARCLMIAVPAVSCRFGLNDSGELYHSPNSASQLCFHFGKLLTLFPHRP